MKDAQKPDHISLNTALNWLREGRYVVPDFQRDFEWQPVDILELMRSIFLDYYIGSFLLWKGKQENFDALACEPLYGYSGQGSPAYIVLDGQQRLTAMHYAFFAPDKPAPGCQNRFLFFLRVDHFMDKDYEEAFIYDWTRRGLNLIRDRDEQFRSHTFPLAVIGEGGWSLPNWVQDYEKYWRKKCSDFEKNEELALADDARRNAEDAEKFGRYLKEITEQYQISYIELDKDLELDKVCDIFTKINSRGIRLDVFDLINALLKPKGLRLKHMWREVQSKLEFVETKRMNVYILQVMSIVAQNYCSPNYLYYLLPGQERKIREHDGSLRRHVLVAGVADFKRRWDDAVESLRQAIDILRHPQEFGAISSRYLPYVSILPVFAALHEVARNLRPPRQLDAQRKIRHWYWASVFTNRYSGSVESTSARDFIDVKTWLAQDDMEPSVVAEFKERFRSLDLRGETKRGTSVYNGIFNLLVVHGARDWMTGKMPQHSDLDDHHIIPKCWAKDRKLRTSIDTILNRTPLTAETNRNMIGNRLPNEYLPELIRCNGEAIVRQTLESHFVSPAAFDILLRNPFSEEDYEAFLDERQRTLQEAIEDLLVKERLDLSPQLRELDCRVEQVELELRKIVATELGDDPKALPQHVSDKLDKRLQTALKKRPGLDATQYGSLTKRLEYADLRELQAAITNGQLWTRFENRFLSKDTLLKRFDQLAELRNAIRHSRTVDEVTRKEGEAALAWFGQAFQCRDPIS